MEGAPPNRECNSGDEDGIDGRAATAFMRSSHLTAEKLKMRNTGGDYIDGSTTTIINNFSNESAPNSGRRVRRSGLRINTRDTNPADLKTEGNSPPEIHLLDVFAAFSSLVSWIFRRPQLQESSHSETGTPESPVKAVEMKNLPVALKPALGTPTPAEIYVCDLMCSGHGLPCWDPRPRQAELQPSGVVPGDVGTYSVDGGFSKIFNLWDVEDAIRKIATSSCNSAYEPLGGTAATKADELVQGTIIAPGADCHSPLPPLPNQSGVVHEFRFPSSAGGILAVLSAANLEITNDKDAMRTYIIQYAQAIYIHARRAGGIKPGESLYFVTGSIKNDLWARAAYQESRAHGPHHIRLLQLSRTGTCAHSRPSSEYRWTRQPAATYPHHDDSGVEGLKNQTLFLQGYKLGVSLHFVSRVEEVLAVSSSEFPGPAGQNSQGWNSGQSGGGNGTSNPGENAPPQNDSNNHGGASTGAGENTSHQKQKDSSERSSSAENVEKEVQFSQFPPSSVNEYHPSDIINKMLLDTTGADIALSHDDDWRHAFRDYSTESAADIMAGPSSTDILRDGQSMQSSRLSTFIQNGVAYLGLGLHAQDDRKPEYRISPHHGFYDILDELRVTTGGLLKIIPASEIQLATRGHLEQAFPYPFKCGAHADIYKANMVSGDTKNRAVVVKVFRARPLQAEKEDKEFYNKRIRREYGVWSMLHHHNILHLEGLAVLEGLSSPGLVSEYKQYGNLLDFMDKHHTFDHLQMAKGVCCGLEYLHSRDVVHGDLTAGKILVDLDNATRQFYPLITAFRTSLVLEKPGYTTSIGDAPLVERPPELLAHSEEFEAVTNKQVLAPASDVYSFSLVLLLLVTGKGPYTEERMPLFIKVTRILDPVNPLRPVPEKYPVLDPSYDFCWPIMQACWKTKKEDRITSREAHSRLSAGVPSSHPLP